MVDLPLNIAIFHVYIGNRWIGGVLRWVKNQVNDSMDGNDVTVSVTSLKTSNSSAKVTLLMLRTNQCDWLLKHT